MNDPPPPQPYSSTPTAHPPAANHMTLNMSQLSFQELEKIYESVKVLWGGGDSHEHSQPITEWRSLGRA